MRVYLFSLVHTLHIERGDVGACQRLACILLVTFQNLTLQLRASWLYLVPPRERKRKAGLELEQERERESILRLTGSEQAISVQLGRKGAIQRSFHFIY